MTPVEVLRRAKALIEERGWAQNPVVVRDESGEPVLEGPLCVGLALGFASGLPAREWAVDAGYVQTFISVIGARPVPWNDYPGRTKEEALAAFDKAIALAEQEAQS